MLTRHQSIQNGCRIDRPHYMAIINNALNMAARSRAVAYKTNSHNLAILAKEWAKYARKIRLHNTVAFRPTLP